VTTACVAVIVLNSSRIADYNRRYGLATEHVDGLVVATHTATKGSDAVTVTWLDEGRRRTRTFDVDDAADFVVGAPFRMVRVPGADEVYPLDRERVMTTEDLETSIVGVVLALLVLQLPWLVRFNAWRRAARAPTTTYRATLLLSFGRGGLVAVPWLRLTGADGETRFQRVMWEPWLSRWRRSVNVAVTARRAGSGPFVVDVPGHGRLWSAGRARRREPRMEALSQGTFTATPSRRWSGPLAAGGLMASVVMLVFAKGGDLGNVLISGAIMGGLGVSVALFYGGPPLYRSPRH
jgi:hypothetical protein